MNTTHLSRRLFLTACAGASAAYAVGGGDALAQTVAPGRTFRGRSEDDWVTQLATRPVVGMVSRHSSTAVVFCLDLGGGMQTGFKPERPGQETWWKHEIVAYRYARLLGIDNRVPVVAGRRVPARAFGRYAASDRLIVQSDGAVRGSASVWMPVLRGEMIHMGPRRREWEGWMVPGAPIPAAQRERARQIAVILVFDWIMANYDRWNCCNVPIDEHGEMVYRDNDAGWFASAMNRVRAPDDVRRLPRALWEKIQRVDGAALKAEVERDPARAEHLIDRADCDAYERRRARLIAHVQNLIRHHGEPAVLAWP